MKINSMGLNYTHGDNFAITRPSGSGDYLFLFIKSPAVVMLRGKEVHADKNSVIFYNKGTPQIYHADHCSYINDFIHFQAESEWKLRSLPFDTLLALHSVRQVNRLLRDLYLEYISKNLNRDESIDLLLKLLLVKINELAACRPQNTALFGYYDVLLDLRSQIYRHPEEKWTIPRLAELASLSSSHFQRLYKNAFGITCIADVIACKMEYAKASLAGSGSSIREIAALCGYENEEHFMRQFKENVGSTPTQYRKKMLEQALLQPSE